MSSPLIRTREELFETCRRFARSRFVTVDTEFLRERTYQAELCLVQLAIEGEHALVDPLAIEDLDPLRELFADSSVVKVLHSGRQDLEIFFELWGELPEPLFDTQVAAALVGHGESIGYAKLVMELLGVHLQKGETRTNWSRRPLRPAQVEYAAADVTHLVHLHEELEEELRERQRGDWLAEEMEALRSPSLYRVDEPQSWKSVKGIGRLSGTSRQLARALAVWREAKARERNLPRRWVIADDSVLDLARNFPRELSELTACRGLNDKAIRRDGAELLALLEEAAERPPASGGQEPAKHPRPKAEQLALSDEMAALVRLRSVENSVSPTLLATRQVLEAVAVSGEKADVPVLRGWRRGLIGEELLDLRDGKIRLEGEGEDTKVVRVG